MPTQWSISAKKLRPYGTPIGEGDLAVLILDDAWSLEPAAPCASGLVGVFSRAEPEGQVDDSVAMRGDPCAQRGAGPDRATEDEPRGICLQDVRRLIRRARLRAAVRVVRASTAISLAAQVPYRILPWSARPRAASDVPR